LEGLESAVCRRPTNRCRGGPARNRIPQPHMVSPDMLLGEKPPAELPCGWAGSVRPRSDRTRGERRLGDSARGVEHARNVRSRIRRAGAGFRQLPPHILEIDPNFVKAGPSVSLRRTFDRDDCPPGGSVAGIVYFAARGLRSHRRSIEGNPRPNATPINYCALGGRDLGQGYCRSGPAPAGSTPGERLAAAVGPRASGTAARNRRTVESEQPG